MEKLPPIAVVPGLPAEERAAILDSLFEPSVPLHTLSVSLMHQQVFDSYDDLIATVGLQVTDLAESTSTSDTQWLHDILAAHPRMGEKKVDSSWSKGEQAHFRAEGGDVDGDLRELNTLYEKTFPGLRYVVFVNGRGRNVIKQDMRTRIGRGNIQLERKEAIKAMCDIAADRARKSV